MSPSVRRNAAITIFVLSSLGSTFAQALGSAAEKPFVTHVAFATTWPNGYSEVWLGFSPTSTRIVSNVDFRALDPGMMIETPAAIHSFFVLSCDLTSVNVLAEQQSGRFDSRGVPKYWPAVLPPLSRPAAYVVFSNTPNSLSKAIDLDGTDALHRYFDTNRVQLLEALQQRLLDAPRIAAEEAARRAAAKARIGPQVTFKRVEYGSPTPTPRQ